MPRGCSDDPVYGLTHTRYTATGSLSAKKSNSTVERSRTRGGSLVRIRGHIDETFQVGEFVAGIHGVLVVDLDAVQRITSFGIREWITALQKLQADYYCFINCTPSIVSQLNLVSGFAGKGEVISFHAPYLCRHCNAPATKVLDLRRSDHRQVVASLEPPPLTCPSCGEESEFDDLPELYFQYFQGAPLPNPPALATHIIDGGDTGQAFNMEKHIADTVTAVWISGTMSRGAYFKHLADGLQGDVVIVAGDIDGVSDDGLAGFVSFLRAPGLTTYLARVPPVLVSSLADTANDLGEAKVVSLMLPCHCSHCHRDVLAEITESALGQLADGPEGSLDLYCPDCARGVSPAPPAEWLAAAQSLPVAALPESVAEYLADRPRGPSVVPKTGNMAPSDPLAERYKIVRRLGSGGMGDVFLARRIGPARFEKLEVIKRIRTDRIEDGEAVNSFLEEARLSARLTHPNIVQIFNLDKVGDEYLLSMEYVDGLDLRTIFNLNEKLSLETPIGICCRIIMDLCQALHAAHTHRDESGNPRPIIHRDVSPGNVMISLDGVAKLTDFGIAKAGDSQNETKSGIIKGTMRYIPPEVLRGPRAKTLHPRIDVYAAGVLLFECLAGRALFTGDGWVHTLRAILRQTIPKLTTERPGVSAALEQAFERAIERDPNKRYQEALEFHRDLEAAAEEMGLSVTNTQLAAWVHDLIDRQQAMDPDDAGTTIDEEVDGETDVGNRANST